MAVTKIYTVNEAGTGGGFVDIKTLVSGQINALGIDTATRDAITIPADTLPIIFNTDTSTLQYKLPGAAWVNFSSKEYADSLVLGLFDDRGNYDASGNTYPAAGGSGTAGVIKKGDVWTLSVAGMLNGAVRGVGSTVRALIDTPAQTNANWAISENNFGYTPENQVNKATDFTILNNTLYASILAVNNQITAKRNENGILANSVADVGTDADLLEKVLKTYTLPGATLAVNGSFIEVEAVLTCAANANLKTIKLHFGATSVAIIDAVAVNDKTVIIKAKINRTAPGGQLSVSEIISSSITALDVYKTRITSPAETLSGDVVIKVTGQNGTATANDIVCKQMIVKNNVLTA